MSAATNVPQMFHAFATNTVPARVCESFFSPWGQSLGRVDINMDVTGVFPMGFEKGDGLYDGVLPLLEKTVFWEHDPYYPDELVGDLVDGGNIGADYSGTGGGIREEDRSCPQ